MAEPFAYAQTQHDHPTRDWTGYCLIFVRTAFGVGSRYASAASAWEHAEHRHPETDPDKIPRGVPVFWTGGSHGYGHIALSRGDGTCWTTDLIRPGKVDVAPIAEVHTRWGLTLVGWTEDINGVRVWTPPTPEPARPIPPQEDDIMPISDDDAAKIAHALLRTKGVNNRTPDGELQNVVSLAAIVTNIESGMDAMAKQLERIAKKVGA